MRIPKQRVAVGMLLALAMVSACGVGTEPTGLLTGSLVPNPARSVVRPCPIPTPCPGCPPSPPCPTRPSVAGLDVSVELTLINHSTLGGRIDSLIFEVFEEGVGVVDRDEWLPADLLQRGHRTRFEPRTGRLFHVHPRFWPRSDTPVLRLRATTRITWDDGLARNHVVESVITAP